MTERKSAQTSMPCGCRIARKASAGEVPDIAFCPLHAAAPRLLAALEGLLPWLERGKERFDREEARALTQALAAVREATRET
jgi:hypothetical protein